MDTNTIIISVIVAGLIVVVAYWYFSRVHTTADTATGVIRGAIQDAKVPVESKYPIPKSQNEKEGLTFSYTCWIYVNDFSYRYGEPKVVFVKGTEDLKLACPALLIDANTNALLVKLDTFGAQETISIPNIPAKKWVHVAIVVDQDSVDVYINGTLYIHHTIAQLPKQNNMPVHTSVGGGFDGKIANLIYYNYFLDNAGVQKAIANLPQPDPNDVAGPTPPYFDMTWWTGRAN